MSRDEDVLMQQLLAQMGQQEASVRAAQAAQQQAAQPQYVVRTGYYAYVRALVADAFVLAIGLALWRVSAYYTVKGVYDLATYLGLTGVAASLTVSWGLSWSLLIPLAISAVEQEFAPVRFGDSLNDEPSGFELGVFIFFAGIGVAATLWGATKDLGGVLTRLAGEDNAWTAGYATALIAIFALAVALELAPEPIIRFFGGRLFVRLPFGGWIARKWRQFKADSIERRKVKNLAKMRARRVR